jgi:hypothetical protein
MYYTVSLVSNSMLFTLILADKEARSFFKLKFLSWKAENMFNLQMLNVFKTKYKIGPIAGTDLEANTTNSEVIVHNDVFDIDFDGVISESNIQVCLQSDDISVIDIENDKTNEP